MDEKNNAINNNTDSQNGMNYSFDFSNQVNSTATPVNSNELSSINGVDQTVDNSAKNVNVNSAPTADASVNMGEVNTNVNSAPTADTSVNMGEVNTNVNPAPTADASVNMGEVNATIPGVAPTIPVTPETVVAQKKEDENIELIKDKKATKNFLIILFVLLLVFIFALPLIFDLMG